ncbi:uncharacterized protein [Atheta coriaria]|uniref:uncharacterized protein isoform X1 n=1 Tax=Dalotia coriaria TaxID=877792 RepID=UPI0031F4016E
MSKVVIYILDKFVWILIVAIFTSQALQIAGVVEGPKDFSLRELHFYSQENNDYAPIHQEELHGVRGKRQAGDRSPLIDNLFNVPISTLNAVNEFIQSARPVIQRLRESAARTRRSNEAKKKLQQQQQQYQRKEKSLKKVPSVVSVEEDEDVEESMLPLQEGPEVQSDGSSSRVLLRV